MTLDIGSRQTAQSPLPGLGRGNVRRMGILSTPKDECHESLGLRRKRILSTDSSTEADAGLGGPQNVLRGIIVICHRRLPK